MRMQCLAAVAATTAWMTCSEAHAQLGYVSGPNSYTIERTLPGASPTGSAVGNYPVGAATVPSPGGDLTYGATGYGGYFGAPRFGIAGYGGTTFGGYAPWAGSGYGYGYNPGTSFYAGYRGYRGYGYLGYGRGRTFGAYPPRFYRSYQPRPFGRFDR
ncbi:MAG TPA: hypothetical protein VHC19_22650 [Pirellulales bacterium]|jgi:hypothetical protein|nr:hypothetical protein [Pirellulales bacterium]